MPVLLPIVSYGFHGTKEQRFLTCCSLFLSKRLLVDKRIVVRVRAAEIFRRCIAAHIAVDARRIDVVSAEHVLLHTIVSIRQARSPKNVGAALVAARCGRSGQGRALPLQVISGMRHLFRLDVLIKLLAAQKTKRDSRLAQADPFLERVLRHLRRFVVADVRVQSRDQHQ